MSDDGNEFVNRLEASGFFNQVGSLQESLSALSEDIATIGGQATQRLEEMESIAAHVMALESVVAVMLKTHPVDPDAVKAEVVKRTREFSEDGEGSKTVQAVAEDIVTS